MSRVLLIGATLMLGAAVPVAAQAPVDFAAGSPVRVQFPSENQAVEGSLVSADRKRMVCEYEAADAETMRRIQREAGAQFERIWVGDVIE